MLDISFDEYHSCGDLNLNYEIRCFNCHFTAKTIFDSNVVLKQAIDVKKRNVLVDKFLLWLEKKSFIRADSLGKIRNEVFTNATRIEQRFNILLTKSVQVRCRTLFCD